MLAGTEAKFCACGNPSTRGRRPGRGEPGGARGPGCSRGGARSPGRAAPSGAGPSRSLPPPPRPPLSAPPGRPRGAQASGPHGHRRSRGGAGTAGGARAHVAGSRPGPAGRGWAADPAQRGPAPARVQDAGRGRGGRGRLGPPSAGGRLALRADRCCLFFLLGGHFSSKLSTSQVEKCRPPLFGCSWPCGHPSRDFEVTVLPEGARAGRPGASAPFNPTVPHSSKPHCKP